MLNNVKNVYVDQNDDVIFKSTYTFLTLFYINSLSILFFTSFFSSFIIFHLSSYTDEDSLSKALVFNCYLCFVV